MAPKVLVTGSGSGLGKYLKNQLNAQGITRENIGTILNNKSMRYETIVHCAFNSQCHESSQENIKLTKTMTELPHKNFVFISSSDVYPTDSSHHKEDEPILLNSARNEYARQKLICEQIVLDNCNKPLIVRSVSLLGKNNRKNTLWKIVNEPQPHLTLTSDSTLNFVSYVELLNLLRLYLTGEIDGIVNFSRSQSITIERISALFKKHPLYGQFRYHVSQLDIGKALRFFPQLKESSQEMLKNNFCLYE